MDNLTWGTSVVVVLISEMVTMQDANANNDVRVVSRATCLKPYSTAAAGMVRGGDQVSIHVLGDDDAVVRRGRARRSR